MTNTTEENTSPILNEVLEKQKREIKKLEKYQGGVGMSKEKRKRKQRHEKLLKRLNLVVESILKRQEEKVTSKNQQLKKRFKRNFLDAVSDLKASLEEIANVKDTSTSQKVSLLPHATNTKLTEKRKRNLLEEESEQLKQVVSHPMFKDSPFQALSQHLSNVFRVAANDKYKEKE
eukprot:jgi/Galph1/3686/GphlegSOOS_G2342.1